ncbi:MAG: patatin-like phospholipase family protein [Actinomycetota bacterium]|nr:patatin-like phospholipase family protein [Actinomycetota bacterium]
MSSARAPTPSVGTPTAKTPRRGVVLGGGGVLGGTWAIGALCALEQTHGFAAKSADVIVGTSAGSVLGALLGCGVTSEEIRQHNNKEVISGGPLAGYHWDPATATGGPRPARPRLPAPGSVKLIGSSLRHLGQLPTTAVLSAFLPEGRKSLEKVGHLIDVVTPAAGWAPRSGIWVVAMDYETGKRVVFGRSGAPSSRLPAAVMASCAIPGWFTPVAIGGRAYIDGGAVSATSVDVVAHAGLDEVYVIAPMVSFAQDQPNTIAARLERRWREKVTSNCVAEANVLRKAGAKVTIVGPGPTDLEAMGANLMDASRRANVLETSMRTSTEAWHVAALLAEAG